MAIKIPVFDGITNNASPLALKDSACVDCSNVLVTNPRGAIDNSIGMSKYNSIHAPGAIVAIHQLKKHGWTNAESLFSLSDTKWWLGDDWFWSFNTGNTYQDLFIVNSSTVNASPIIDWDNLIAYSFLNNGDCYESNLKTGVSSYKLNIFSYFSISSTYTKINNIIFVPDEISKYFYFQISKNDGSIYTDVRFDYNFENFSYRQTLTNESLWTSKQFIGVQSEDTCYIRVIWSTLPNDVYLYTFNWLTTGKTEIDHYHTNTGDTYVWRYSRYLSQLYSVYSYISGTYQYSLIKRPTGEVVYTFNSGSVAASYLPIFTGNKCIWLHYYAVGLYRVRELDLDTFTERILYDSSAPLGLTQFQNSITYNQTISNWKEGGISDDNCYLTMLN